MASTTGIEIGPDSYLLAGIRASREGAAEILTARRFAAGEWPADRRAFGDALATIRKSHHFPRRAAVVLWNTTDGGDGASEHDPLATLTAAGFEIVSVMTPPAALAKVAATTPRGAPADAIAWLALNTCGASISIVREADLLYSRTFSWSYNPDLPNSKSQLLQRYLLISHLAPELNHALRVVHAAHGANVALAVTCGNLPELRSLTLPLIEELDIEVETLDSTDGFASTRAGGFDVTELAPALRLVTAAALAAGPSQNAWTTSWIPRVAAAAAVITALAWAGYSFFHTATPTAARQASAPQPPPSPAVSPSQSAMNPPPQPVATRGSDEPKRAVSQTAQPSRPSSTQQSQPTPSDTRKAVTPQTSSTAALLTEPLPRIDTVLIDQDRRLAILDGAVVGVGDPVGSRVVVAIAREAILLREPSGRIVRVRPRVGM